MCPTLTPISVPRSRRNSVEQQITQYDRVQTLVVQGSYDEYGGQNSDTNTAGVSSVEPRANTAGIVLGARVNQAHARASNRSAAGSVSLEQYTGEPLLASLPEQFAVEISLIERYANEDWSTAYRDFAQVPVLIRIGRQFGMVPSLSTNSITAGWIYGPGGERIRLKAADLIKAFGYEWGSWKNKVTLYFRVLKFLRLSEDEDALERDMEGDMRHMRSRLLEWVVTTDSVLPEGHRATRYYTSEKLRGRLAVFLVSRHYLSIMMSLIHP